jgi:tetratricopeptide (TPR) repeat protein
LIILFAVLAQQACGEPPPNVADVRFMVDSGDYRGAIAAAKQVLATAALPGVTAPDRATLYELAGEAHIRLKQFAEAADAFAAAARAASDPDRSSRNHATDLLLRRTRNGLYHPVQPAPDGARRDPVDVTNARARHAAFAVLFTDEWAAAVPKVRQALAATSVAQVCAAVDLVGPLRSLERTATDGDVATRPVLATIAAHGKPAFDIEVRRLEQRANDIRTAANATVRYYTHVDVPAGQAGPNVVGRSRHTGLSKQNRAELQAVMAACERCKAAADLLAETADKPDVPDWSDWALRTDRTRDLAFKTLSTDYSFGTQDR